MNCTRARAEIALWAGGDLDQQQAAQVERHAVSCPDCRAYCDRMRQSLQLLQQPSEAATFSLHDSVWPNVDARLAADTQAEAERADRLSRWLPAAAIAAACLAVMAITSGPQPRDLGLDGRPLPQDRHIFDRLNPYSSDAVVTRPQPGNGMNSPEGRLLDDLQSGNYRRLGISDAELIEVFLSSN